MIDTRAAATCVLAMTALAGGIAAQEPADAALRDVIGDEFAVLEMSTPRLTYYVHEPVPVRLRFGYDTRFFEEQAVPLFLRRLDLPIQLQATWLDDAAASLPNGERPPGGRQRSFALNGGVARADVVGYSLRNGRRFEIVELRLRLLPDDFGELVLDGPLLRFAFGTRFRHDFVSGRVAEDRREAYVYGRPLSLTIRPLPEAGRPLDFSGAVGRFEVRADAFPRQLEQGRTFQLALDIEGRGNVGRFDPPDLHDLDPFVWFGQDVRETPRGLAVTYELSPRSAAVTQVPPIPFAFFDIEARAYRTVWTDAIPLDVREPAPDRPALAVGDAPPGLGESGSGGGGAESAGPAPPGGEAPAEGEPFWAAAWFPLASLVLLSALALWVWRRSRSGPSPDPAAVRRAAAAAAFHRALADPDADVGLAFSAFLASCLGTTTASVMSPDLSRRLAAAGVEAGQAQAAATLLQQLVAVRYGGQAPTDGRDRARELVARIAAQGAAGPGGSAS